jgi:hypothetical protein
MSNAGAAGESAALHWTLNTGAGGTVAAIGFAMPPMVTAVLARVSCTHSRVRWISCGAFDLQHAHRLKAARG